MWPFFQDDGAHFFLILLIFAEIKLKQQLVDKLEKNLHSIKQQYEEKMQVLQQQIKSIEVERDKMNVKGDWYVGTLQIQVYCTCMLSFYLYQCSSCH